MKITSRLETEQVKSFSDNHRKQKITLTTYNKKTSAIFEARLTLAEFKTVCNFIATNFDNDGRK